MRRSIDESSIIGPGAHSVLYNAMIHPFTRMVIYGSIWYQGEANAGAPQHYTCLFSKMIAYWRQTWHARTNGSTDLLFPFGFVQVRDLYLFFVLFIRFYSCQRIPKIQRKLVVFHGFVGIKHLMLVTCQTMLFLEFSWLLL